MLRIILYFIFIIVLFVFPSTSQAAGTIQSTISTTRVSVSSTGEQSNNDHNSYFHHDVSPDGRYVVFESSASNLVSGDTNEKVDIFLRDRQIGETTRISISTSTEQANGHSSYPSISANGRYVAFSSEASNLVAGDNNNVKDVFLRDRQTGQTVRVSVSSDGSQTIASSTASVISDDGNYVAFVSGANNLVAGDTNSCEDVFIHDRQSGQTTRVSVSSSSEQTNAYIYPEKIDISGDGRFVAFQTSASNLVAGDTNGYDDIFVRDRQTNQTTRVSIASDGTQATAYSLIPAISTDGRYVAFHSPANNLVAGDTNTYNDVFVHDRQTGYTVLVSVSSSGEQGNFESIYCAISGEGRFIAFESNSSNLVNGVPAGIFLHDRQTGQTTSVSVSSSGEQANNWSFYPALSTDGRFIVFASLASNLVTGDTNGLMDLFLHDREILTYQIFLPMIGR